MVYGANPSCPLSITYQSVATGRVYQSSSPTLIKAVGSAPIWQPTDKMTYSVAQPFSSIDNAGIDLTNYIIKDSTSGFRLSVDKANWVIYQDNAGAYYLSRFHGNKDSLGYEHIDSSDINSVNTPQIIIVTVTAYNDATGPNGVPQQFSITVTPDANVGYQLMEQIHITPGSPQSYYPGGTAVNGSIQDNMRSVIRINGIKYVIDNDPITMSSMTGSGGCNPNTARIPGVTSGDNCSAYVNQGANQNYLTILGNLSTQLSPTSSTQLQLSNVGSRARSTPFGGFVAIGTIAEQDNAIVIDAPSN